MMRVNLSKTDPGEAMEVIQRLAERHGFIGQMFTPEDVEALWYEIQEGQNLPVEDRQPFTPEVFAQIQATPAWNGGIQRAMGEIGWENLHDVLEHILDGSPETRIVRM